MLLVENKSNFCLGNQKEIMLCRNKTNSIQMKITEAKLTIPVEEKYKIYNDQFRFE